MFKNESVNKYQRDISLEKKVKVKRFANYFKDFFFFYELKRNKKIMIELYSSYNKNFIRLCIITRIYSLIKKKKR